MKDWESVIKHLCVINVLLVKRKETQNIQIGTRMTLNSESVGYKLCQWYVNLNAANAYRYQTGSGWGNKNQ